MLSTIKGGLEGTKMAAAQKKRKKKRGPLLPDHSRRAEVANQCQPPSANTSVGSTPSELRSTHSHRNNRQTTKRERGAPREGIVMGNMVSEVKGEVNELKGKVAELQLEGWRIAIPEISLE